MTISEKAKKIIRRIFRIVLTTILVIFGILLMIILLIQTSPVQNYGRAKLEAYLENKLKTRVRIGHVYIGLPTKITIKNIYLEDRQKDTLLYGGNIEINMNMLRLFKKELNVSSVLLENVTVKVKRQMPDSVFNFQFIADAFSSGTPKTPTTDKTAGLRFVLGTLKLHHIHGLYADDASGNDLLFDLGGLQTDIKTFDPGHDSYAIPLITLDSVDASLRQFNPILILKHLADTISVHNQQAQPIHLNLGDIDFSKIKFSYRNEANKMNANLGFDNFHTTVDSLDLEHLHFKLKSIALKNTQAKVSIDKSTPVVAKKQSAKIDTVTHKGTWGADIATVDIEETYLQYDDNNKKPIAKGMDFNHLLLNHFSLHSKNLHADPDNYKALITGISFSEKSGLTLKKMSVDASYGKNGFDLNRLTIQTNRSEIYNQTNIHYKDIDNFKKNPGNVEANLQFDKTRIAVQDVLVFVPSLAEPLKGTQNAVLRLSGRVNGKLNNLYISNLQIEGVGNTSLVASGRITGMPNAKKARYDIVLSRLKTSRTDLFRFIPAKSFPESISLPESISADGKFAGTFSHFNVHLHLTTSKGNALINGMLNLDQKSYDLTAKTNSVDLGYILKQDSLLGKITLNATAKGQGFDPQKITGEFHVELIDGEIKSYDYKGLKLDASLQNGSGNIQSSMQDPNITYNLNADLNFSQKFPAVKMKLELDTINFLALHLMQDSLQLHSMLDADFPSSNPDSLSGKLNIHDINFTWGQKSFHTDSTVLVAAHTDSGQSIVLNSEIADLNWGGQYKITQTVDVFKKFINNYYKLSDTIQRVQTDPQAWDLSLVLRPSPLALMLMPSIKGSDTLMGHVSFNSEKKDLKLNIRDKKIQVNDQVIHQFNVDAHTTDTALLYTVSLADAGKPGFRILQTAVYGSLADNKLNTNLRLKDKKAQDLYLVSAQISKQDNGLRLALKPDSLILNYQKWTVPADNYIQYDSGGIIVHNLKLGYRDQSIAIQSKEPNPKSPVDVSFKDFRIRTIMEFVMQDSLLMDGTINGTAEVKDIFMKPLFTADTKIDSLSFKKDTLGNLIIKISNDELNSFIAHIKLSGFENDVQLDGKYFSGESKMDMELKIGRLNLATIKTLASSQVSRMSGYLAGNLHASGDLDHPVLKGDLHFEDAVIIPVITGEPLKLSKDAISFDEDGFNFDNFVMQDSAGNKATLDGNVYTKDFRDYKFDMSLSAQNFRVIYAPKEPNRTFYGKLNINADIDVTGDMNLPKINANLRANKNTDFFLILPSDNPEVVDREGVVVFVNKAARQDSTKFKSFLDSLASHASLKGMDVSATLETDSSAQFTLIIDERNGDALAIRGRAELVSGIDKSGKITLTGNYELVNGSYNLTLSVLHREFQIQRGSKITWTGDPKTANIDITAIYTVNTAPIDLMEQSLSGQSPDQVNRYKERLPFQVKLSMTGELLKPIIKFDISLPYNLLSLWPDVDLKLQQMRTDEAEINKQTFALLLLGRFVQENPFQSAGGSTDAGTIAKQSASKILSDQLNQLAGSLVKGVDINFDMNSSQDYTSGSTTNQTDLNVKVSKSLFDDRLRVSVGSDFQLEQTNQGQNPSNIAGDIDVDYKLSKDGRYMIRVYRKDQYETIVQGQVVETGLSFILTFDYNKFRELFEKKKVPPASAPKSHKKAPPENPPAK